MIRILFLLMVAFTCLQANATLSDTDFSKNNYISEWGRLQLKGNQLSDKNGNAIQLKGWSSFGWMSNWGDCHSNGALDAMKGWGANIYRGAMYVAEGGYNNDKSGFITLTKHFIDYTAEIGIYYLCDWHVLTPGDPNDGTYSDAVTYFNEISSYVKAQGYTHVLYEICNEPNGVSWSQIKSYADKVLPTIQSNDPGAVVVVGTPQWDQNIGDAVNDPITNYSNLNIMYAFHFYSCSHAQFLSALDNATKSIPVFISEWGIAEFSGGAGTRDVADACITNAKSLMTTAGGYNQGGQKISWCSWSFGEKNEQASAVLSCGSLEPSTTGTEVIALMGGKPTPPVPTACYENTCAKIPGILDLGKYDNNPADLTSVGAGEGVSYHEENTVADEVNDRSTCNGAFMWAGDDYTFRINECVDASGCYGLQNTEGWHNLGYIEPGEWTIYTVDVEEPGYYSIEALCNPTTKQVLSISSMTEFCNLTYDLDTKTEISEFSIYTSFPTANSATDWQNWAWVSPVKNVGLGRKTALNAGVLFKTAGKQSIKISFLSGPSETIKASGDLGPLRFTKAAEYTGAVDYQAVSDKSSSIYPNPNTGSFSVSLAGDESVEMTIVNTVGQVLYSSVVNDGDKIDTELKAGVYYVTFNGTTSSETKKLIVK